MDLPKNITQIGETDRNCKVYVEDYVVSYMRQMNKMAEDKELSIALYGKMSEEQQITYCFVYGACQIQLVTRDVRHLSQAQNQEIERMRRKYFPEQEFLGYQILNGDMIEGFRIYDQNSCRYVKGYACFFEKNDTMLAYMLDARMEEAQPEKVEQDKYEMVKKRQEERRARFEDRQIGRKFMEQEQERKPDRKQIAEKEPASEEKEAGKFKLVPFMATAAGCLALLTVLGNGNLQEKMNGQLLSWWDDIKQIRQEQGDKEDSDPIILVGQVQESQMLPVMSTLVTEDKLAEAVLEENEKATEEAVVEETTSEELKQEEQKVELQESDTSQENTGEQETSMTQENTATQDPTVGLESTVTQEPVIGQESTQSQEQQPPKETPQRMESYVIQKGDTLIAISTSIYGSDAAVGQICALNNITNPDNIQIGQKILLP